MAHTPDLLASFQLTLPQLQEIATTLQERIHLGLRQDGQEVRAIPTYLAPPPQGICGRVLVIDTGGTNIRAAIIELRADGSHNLVAGPLQAQVPTGRQSEPVSAQDFFRAQAELALQLNPEADLPLGYCFSYPAASTPQADARLLHWTKDMHVQGVEGELVGQMLKEALAQLGYQAGKATVLNDTVATLLAGAGANSRQYDHFIGLIAGTGTNMAGFVPVRPDNKLSSLPWKQPSMAVNLESGNFTPPYLNRCDDLLDSRLDLPGHQRFEKALAGYYLPFLYALADPLAQDFDPYQGSKQLVELRDRQHDDLAAAILTRSGQLIAAGLAGFIKVLGQEGRVCITAEGSRYWNDPALPPLVANLLPQLISPQQTFSIIRIEDANLVGSAYAALAQASSPEN